VRDMESYRPKPSPLYIVDAEKRLKSAFRAWRDRAGILLSGLICVAQEILCQLISRGRGRPSLLSRVMPPVTGYTVLKRAINGTNEVNTW